MKELAEEVKRVYLVVATVEHMVVERVEKFWWRRWVHGVSWWKRGRRRWHGGVCCG